MRIYLVRHGKTLMNQLNKGQGWLDSDLTEEGIKELHEIFSNTDFPVFDRAYSSDLGRSIETLEIMKEYVHIENPETVHTLKELRERFLGSLEGDSLKEMRLSLARRKGYENYSEYQKENSFADYIDDNYEADPNGYGESFAMFENRVREGIERVIDEGTRNNCENILVVAHQNSIGLIQHILLEKESSFERIQLENGGFLVFSNDSGVWKQLEEIEEI